VTQVLIDFFFDFETRSRLDIKDVDTVKYALHPSTEATLITYCFGRTGQLKYWKIGDAIPEDILDVAINPQKYHFVAFNLFFDYMIWMHSFLTKQGIAIQPIPLSNLSDAMALTCHFRSGSSLDRAAKIFNLPLQKDQEGRRIMLKQCKPNSKGVFPVLTDKESEAFIRYGLLDTRILREVYYRCPPLPSSERWVFEWTFLRNLKGIRVDERLVQEMNRIVNTNMPQMEKAFSYYTGGSFTIRSASKCLDWFRQYWPWIKDMRKDTVRDMLMDCEGKPEHAVNALKIKEMAGSGSIAKIAVAFNTMHMSRIYNLLVYHKAQTKRFAGYGIQIQNMPRPTKIPDELTFDLNSKDIVTPLLQVEPSLKSPIQFVKNLIRRIWVPDEGQYLYCGDFSKVEPTCLRWLAGMGPIPPLVYEEMAEAIYNIPVSKIGKDSEERQIGKAAELGGGYGMGWKKFRADVYEKTGIVLSEDMAKHVIKVYREKNKAIADLWKELENAFRLAIKGESSIVCTGKVAVSPMQLPHKGVQIRLPSGGLLFYHGAHIRWEDELVEIITVKNGATHIEKKTVTRENIYYVGENNGTVTNIKIYGGQLTEHVTSATSRELLTPAMWRLEHAGFDVLCTVHDEIWAQSHPNRDEEFKRLMIQRPSWASEIDLSASLENGYRYLK
jgi:DNA polymerase